MTPTIPTKQNIKEMHILAKDCYERYKVLGGDNNGTHKILLNQEKLKVAWLIEKYGKEFDELFEIYKLTGEYMNALKI